MEPARHDAAETRLTMTETQIEAMLMNLLSAAMNGDESELDEAAQDVKSAMEDIRAYDEAGVMTTDRGFLMTRSNGNEFQITIKRSR